MYDIITIGSATRDVFIRSAAMEITDCDHSPTGADACFPLGSKIDVQDMVMETGGGATNAAVTFSRLGLRTATVTAVGDDANGRDILAALKADGVSTALVQTDRARQTAFSVIILSGSGERTILVHRGASENIRPDLIPWSKLKAKWFYITSLGGKIEVLQQLLEQADRHGIRVAWNPGGQELRNGWEKLAIFIRQVDVFNINLEEAMLLTDTRSRSVRRLLAPLRRLPRLATIITDGINGAYADDGKRAWHSGVVQDIRRINTTGAGDAFGSGLVAALARKADLPQALAVGTLNASGVVQQMGAKRGILRKYPSPRDIKKIPVMLWK